MEVADRSSSNDLSSAPSSGDEGSNLLQSTSAHPNTIVVAQSTSTTSLPSSVAIAKSDRVAARPPVTRQDGAPPKPSKARKKKVDPNAPPASEKEKSVPKPRKAPATGARASKKQKTEDTPPVSTISQQTAQSAHLSTSRLVQPLSFASDTRPTFLNEDAKTTQNGFSNQTSAMHSQPQSPSSTRYQTTPQPQPAAPRLRNIFDPVRGIERSSEPIQTVTYPSLSATPPRQTFRPSASPAISSIINHPESDGHVPSSAVSMPKPQVRQTFEAEPTSNGTNSYKHNDVGASSADIVPSRASPPEKPVVDSENKPKRAKEQPPPMPVGSGLLSSSFFGGDSMVEKSDKVEKGINIVLQIDLKKDENKIFNFARLAEEKYGFAAVYPRQAAQKEKLARVAAAGAALERAGSGNKRGEVSVAESGEEDLSVDIDSENDGDIHMTGMNGTNENSGTDGPAPKQRRKRKDDYDMEDPFVDDSEALWEAQAAASRDGFFVYMGSLVTEEKPPADKVEGTSKRGGRGRGRGGGVGSRGGRGGAASGAGNESTTKGAGPGSRGGGTTRKPRITKAERQQRELEKKHREQAGSALSTKPPVAAV